MRVPQSDGAALAAIEGGMVVHSRAYEGNLVRLVVSGPASLVGRLRKYRLRDDNPSDDCAGAVQHAGREGRLNPAESEDKSITTLASREVYRNQWMRLREDKILRSNGKEGHLQRGREGRLRDHPAD